MTNGWKYRDQYLPCRSYLKILGAALYIGDPSTYLQFQARSSSSEVKTCCQKEEMCPLHLQRKLLEWDLNHRWKRNYASHLKRKIQCTNNNWSLAERWNDPLEEMMQVTFTIFLQASCYPTKIQFGLHKIDIDSINDPLKCLSKRHNNHVQEHSQSFQETCKSFLCIPIFSEPKIPYKWESISIYRSLKYKSLAPKV